MDKLLEAGYDREKMKHDLTIFNQNMSPEEFTTNLRKTLKKTLEQTKADSLMLILESLSELGFKVNADYKALDLYEMFKLLLNVGYLTKIDFVDS
jgi:hypothetical protein